MLSGEPACGSFSSEPGGRTSTHVTRPPSSRPSTSTSFCRPSRTRYWTRWRVCEELGLSLHVAGEPLDRPRDRALAEQVIAHRATVRATSQSGLAVDLTLVMTAFDFEEVWRNRRVFAMDGFEVPVARLRHIIESKGATAREKDRLFLATHRAALREMLDDDTD